MSYRDRLHSALRSVPSGDPVAQAQATAQAASDHVADLARDMVELRELLVRLFEAHEAQHRSTE